MRNTGKGFTLSREDKEELLKMSRSRRLREDFRKIAENRYNPFLINGVVDLNRLVSFLTDYNEFINHARRPFRKMIDKKMLL